jgi:pimeloyl-ACP methyl ester carboxylesterase
MTIRYEPIAPPGLLGTLQELRLPLDAALWAPQWLMQRATQKRQPAAEPQTVLVLPGFGADHRSMWVLSAYLRSQGHTVSDWGLGRNTGRVPELLEAMDGRLQTLARQAGRPVALVGWSLGGYLAREMARNAPDAVRQVVTLGSPVIGGPRFTAVAPWYRIRGQDLESIEREVAERFNTPLRVPVTAVYSKRDGVVAWQACIDHWSPQVQHIEVAETHLGMGVAPAVLAIVGEALASVEVQ